MGCDGAPMSAVLAAVLAYAERGWPVFPCVPKEKRPLTSHGFKDATTDRHAIEEMWERWPDANVGLVTGARSSMVVLDVDGTHGHRSLDELQNTHGKFPETAESRTGRGGRHLLFLHPGEKVGNRIGFKPGLDVRGDGGYIVAPPSRTVGLYTWLRDPSETQVAPAPLWFLEQIQQSTLRALGQRGHRAQISTENKFVADPHRYAEAAFAKELANLSAARTGERNATLNNAAFAVAPFVRDGLLDADLVTDCLLEIAVRKGLPRSEAQRTIRSGLEAGTVKRLRVWDRARLISRLPISARGKLLLHVLSNYANRDGWSWPSQRTLIQDCSFGGFRALKQALKEVEPFVEVQPMPGGRGRARHSYRLRWDVIEKARRVLPTDPSLPSLKEQPLRMESYSALTVGAKGCKGRREEIQVKCGNVEKSGGEGMTAAEIPDVFKRVPLDTQEAGC